MKLRESFYQRENVLQVTRDLLGKYLMTGFNDEITGGMIVEAEAYEGVTDRASHAYGNRRTARTEIMYHPGGTAYVYLCYGIHSLFNIVTNAVGIPHAVLIRGILPEIGIEVMKRRTGKARITVDSGIGPGRVSSLLGIHYSHTGLSLMDNRIWVEDRGVAVAEQDIITGPRVGVDYAGPDALLPYRLSIRQEAYPK
jgi:DNA-3-methyladenine glycosylase